MLLYPGRTCDLPEEHPWVQRMVKRGYLAPMPGHPAQTETAMPPAEKENA